MGRRRRTYGDCEITENLYLDDCWKINSPGKKILIKNEDDYFRFIYEKQINLKYFYRFWKWTPLIFKSFLLI